MRAGQRRYVGVLQSPVYNPSGDEIVSWANVATNVRCAIRPMRGREMAEAGREVSEQDFTITILYRTGIDTVKRFVANGVTYDIRSVANVEMRNVDIELTCQVVK